MDCHVAVEQRADSQVALAVGGPLLDWVLEEEEGGQNEALEVGLQDWSGDVHLVEVGEQPVFQEDLEEEVQKHQIVVVPQAKGAALYSVSYSDRVVDC